MSTRGSNRPQLSHGVIVKAPSLLPMLYKPAELEQELGVPVRTLQDWLAHGVPHHRDETGHLWINGRDLAAWVEQQRSSRSLPTPAVDQGYCLRCRKVITISNLATLQCGKHALLQGNCPNCGARSTEAYTVVNRRNYLWYQEYLTYLREVRQLDEQSVTRYRAYLRHLLLWADETLWSQCSGHRPTLPAYVIAIGHDEPSGILAPATIKRIIQTAQRLFRWAKLTHPLEFKDLPEAWIDTLRPPRQAQRIPEHHFVTLDEVIALAALPIDPADLALRRDQAGAALLFLSGMRVGALGSLPISAVDIPTRTLKQWPRLGVRTKLSKTATTYLLNIPQLLTVVERWDSFIRAQLPPTAMWYTPTENHWGEQALSAQPPGVNRSVAIGKRLRRLYAAAGLPYQSPHKFRHGHAVWALQHAPTMADYKAVSMNLMHDDIRITDSIYSPLLGSEIQQRITNLAGAAVGESAASGAQPVSLQGLSKKELVRRLQELVDGLASAQQ